MRMRLIFESCDEANEPMYNTTYRQMPRTTAERLYKQADKYRKKRTK